MADSRGFFGAISTDSENLDRVIQRADVARKQGLTRFFTDHNGCATVRHGECDVYTVDSAAAFDGCSSTIGGLDRPASNQPTRMDGPAAWVAGNLENAAAGMPRGSPAEIARAAFERWGTNCFARLDGNFCMAIFDPLLPGYRIASDLAGTKPVFYAIAASNQQIRSIVFGSSAKEVLRCTALPAEVNARALQRYMVHGVLSGQSDTLFKNVHALRRHHYLEILPTVPLRVRQVRFDDEFAPEARAATLQERSDELRALLLHTVTAQSRRGNVAVALSGGVDSTGILGCLRHVRGKTEPLNAYFYRQRDPVLPPRFNEQPWAELATKRLGAQLNSVELTSGELPALLGSVLHTADFPFSSPVILAQAKLFQVAAENGAEVMLSGHGPDLLFGGGTSHLLVHAARSIRAGKVRAAVQILRDPDLPLAGVMRLLVSALLRAAGITMPPGLRRSSVPWASNAWFRERVSPEQEPEVKTFARHRTPMHALIHEQLSHSLGPTSLLYEEGNARANGLENCQPYLVAALVHFSRSCPPEFMITDQGQAKHVLRLALKGLVPEEILGRRNRIGFAVPTLPWLLQQRKWVDAQFRELGSLPFFCGAPATGLWEGLEAETPMAWAHAHRVWKWIVLLQWARENDLQFDA